MSVPIQQLWNDLLTVSGSCYITRQAERSYCLYWSPPGIAWCRRYYSSQHERERCTGILAIECSCTPDILVRPDGLCLPLQTGWCLWIWICRNWWYWRATSKQPCLQLRLFRDCHVVLGMYTPALDLSFSYLTTLQIFTSLREERGAVVRKRVEELKAQEDRL